MVRGHVIIARGVPSTDVNSAGHSPQPRMDVSDTTTRGGLSLRVGGGLSLRVGGGLSLRVGGGLSLRVVIVYGGQLKVVEEIPVNCAAMTCHKQFLVHFTFHWKNAKKKSLHREH